jgi:hypothetical protein
MTLRKILGKDTARSPESTAPQSHLGASRQPYGLKQELSATCSCRHPRVKVEALPVARHPRHCELLMLASHARKRAAPSLVSGSSLSSQSIWISDEQLTQAWDNFVVSRNRQPGTRRSFTRSIASRETRPQCEARPDERPTHLQHLAKVTPRRHVRHGSNVPGPLEAIRRLQKRRMVALARSPSLGSGTQADVSALFGPDLQWKGTSPYGSRFKFVWQEPSILLEESQLAPPIADEKRKSKQVSLLQTISC